MRPRSPVKGSSPAGTIPNSETMDVWVEGSDKRRPTNGPVLKSFYDNETDQWVGPDDTPWVTPPLPPVSYPPCRCYAFNRFYPYFLTMSSSPLFLMIHSFPTTHYTPLHFTNHSHTPCSPCSLCFTINGNIFYLWQNNVVKDSSWPLSYLV